MKAMRLFAAISLVFGLGACSDDSGGTTPDPDEGKTFESTITAASGGTLETESGSAKLEVPAGALAADTKLTVTVAAKEGDTVTSVYEFGPDGTQFQTPVTLSIKYDGTPGTDKKAVLATFVDGKWTEIEGSTLVGGMVSAPVTHFSKFSIIIVDGQAVLTSGCADVAQSFSACGGDVVGTWKFQDMCFDDFPLGSNPWEQSCPAATVDFEVTWDATVTIDASNITLDWVEQTTDYAYNIPMNCLPTDAQCTDVSDTDITCAEQSGTCVCSGSQSVTDIATQTMAYTISGNDLIVQDQASPYCRQGDKLIVKGTMPAGDKQLTYYQVLVKQ